MNHEEQNNLEEAMQATAQEPVKQVKAPRKVFERLPDDENTKKALSCGNILKEARQEQGLSLETVHETTKIPLDALRAIEEGYKIRSLSTFYYNGFVKIYAKFLGLDASELLGLVPNKVIPHMSDSPMAVDFDLIGWSRSFFTRRRKKQLVVAVGILLGLFLVFKMASAVSSWMKRPKAEKKIVKIEKKATTAVIHPCSLSRAMALHC
jgi:cytoskeletal protein RodZ